MNIVLIISGLSLFILVLGFLYYGIKNIIE
jgi:hypothetical protein